MLKYLKIAVLFIATMMFIGCLSDSDGESVENIPIRSDTGEIYLQMLPDAIFSGEAQKLVDFYSDRSLCIGCFADDSLVIVSDGVIGKETKCRNDGKQNGCIGAFDFMMPAVSPMTIVVTLKNSKGKVVNRFGYNLLEDDLKNAFENFVSDRNCIDFNKGESLPLYGSGQVLGSVWLYPIDMNGKKLPSGKYVADISLEEQGVDYCISESGYPMFVDGYYRKATVSLESEYVSGLFE